MFIGRNIKKERILRGLSLLDVASDCGISESQLYKIENNKVAIRNTTLLKLATYYGYDIIDNYTKLIDFDIISIFRMINQDINSRDINKINKSFEIVNYTSNKSTNPVVKSVTKQYHYLINGILCLSKKDYFSAGESFLDGIKTFNPFIDTNSFNNIGSSNLQLRLLMAYALTYRHTQDFDKSLYILDKVINNTANKSIIHKKATYNIANIYSLINSYDMSINTLNNYLESVNLNKNINYDNIIYFKKATVLYRLGNDSYKKYALKCLYSSILSGDIQNGLFFLNVFNNLFDNVIMTAEEFLNL